MTSQPSQSERLNGWYIPDRARNAHFFDKGSPYSQCRRWTYDERGMHIGNYIVTFCKACEKGMGRA